jgi:hypothetical protein
LSLPRKSPLLFETILALKLEPSKSAPCRVPQSERARARGKASPETARFPIERWSLTAGGDAGPY